MALEAARLAARTRLSLSGVYQPPYPQQPPPPARRKPGLVVLIVLLICLAVGVVSVGGYLILRAVNKSAEKALIAAVLDPADSPSTLAEITQHVVSMPEVDVVYEASPDELPQWFPGKRPWGAIRPGAYLVKLKPGANRDTVKANLRNLPGVYMVVDVPDTGKTIGASGPAANVTAQAR